MKSKKRTWILLRGLGREKGHWGHFYDSFANQFSMDEVLALDLPGVGEFRGEKSPRDMTEIFQFVRAKAVERTKAQTTFNLVALSLGAMVALEWMRQKPDDLSGAVLINPSSRQLSPATQRMRWQVWKTVLSILAMQAPRDREKALAELVINSAAAQEKAIPLWARLAVEHPIRYINFFNQLMAAGRFAKLPNPGAVPVLMLTGLGDRLVDPSCSFLMQKKMGWPLEKHPWGGHDLTWDDPDWVIQHIQSWLGSEDRIPLG